MAGGSCLEDIAAIDLHHGKIIPVHLRYQLTDASAHLLTGELHIIGHHHVEDEVRVAGAGHDAEVVYGEPGVDGFHLFRHSQAQPLAVPLAVRPASGIS